MNVPARRRYFALGLALVLTALVVEGAAHRHETRIGYGATLELVAPSDDEGFWDCCRCRLADHGGLTTAPVRHDPAVLPLDGPIPGAAPRVARSLEAATRVPRAPPASSSTVVS